MTTVGGSRSTRSATRPRPNGQRIKHNSMAEFSSTLLKSEVARTNAQLMDDYTSALRGNAFYLEQFLSNTKDFTVFEQLVHDTQLGGTAMEEGNNYGTDEAAEGGKASRQLVDWSKHKKVENPDFSDTFQAMTRLLADYFDLEIYATRLNFYADNKHWKPFHHDSHAYGGASGKREDFTAGLSFGGTRDLAFKHDASGHQFTFPQKNGDVFAFTNDVNQNFMHGVPKLSKDTGPRLSVIVWGRRNTLNERNSNTTSISRMIPERTGRVTMGNVLEDAHALVGVQEPGDEGPQARSGELADQTNTDDAAAKRKQQKKAKKRLQ